MKGQGSFNYFLHGYASVTDLQNFILNANVTTTCKQFHHRPQGVNPNFNTSRIRNKYV